MMVRLRLPPPEKGPLEFSIDSLSWQSIGFENAAGPMIFMQEIQMGV